MSSARAVITSDAYTKAEGPDTAKAITIAEGFTPLEANALGLFSFKVVPTRKKDDPIPLEAYGQAMRREARGTLLGPKSKELRYARIEDAQQAH